MFTWLVIEPDGNAFIHEAAQGNTSDDLRRLAAGGGLIARVPLGNGLDMWLDDEGLLKQAPINRMAMVVAQQYSGRSLNQILVGTAVLTGDDGSGEAVSIPEGLLLVDNPESE